MEEKYISRNGRLEFSKNLQNLQREKEYSGATVTKLYNFGYFFFFCVFG